MLIVTRRVGETVMIGDDIEVFVLEIEMRPPGQVRIGIEAPRHIPVDRREIWEAKRADRQNALSNTSTPKGLNR